MSGLFCRFWFTFAVQADLFYAARHVLCAMAARPHATFAHTKTVRLMVKDGMEINALEIVRSLPDSRRKLLVLSPISG